MQSLVMENIYEEVNITDYQGVCYMNINDGNPANILQTVSYIDLSFTILIHISSYLFFSFGKSLQISIIINFLLCFFLAIHISLKINQMDDQINCMGHHTNLHTTDQCE